MLRLLQITDEIVDRVPDGLKDKAGQIADQVRSDPALTAILIGVGVLTLALFIWGIARQALKAALTGAVLTVGAWFAYFTFR